MRAWVGADPGGRGAFGLAVIFEAGGYRSWCVSSADEAISELVNANIEPLGAGVDAPLWWSSGESGGRLADKWIRDKYGISGGTVQAANSLRGAALVQGQMFVQRLRERFSDCPVTEAHPKAVALALGDWNDPRVLQYLVGYNPKSDHERDAYMCAVAAREGRMGRWSRDLSLDRYRSEQDPKTYWLGPVSYFWPNEGA